MTHFLGSPRGQRPTYPALWLYDDGSVVLLRHQHAGGEGRLDHVDDQVVGQNVQLLHLITRHVSAASNAVTEETRMEAKQMRLLQFQIFTFLNKQKINKAYFLALKLIAPFFCRKRDETIEG